MAGETELAAVVGALTVLIGALAWVLSYVTSGLPGAADDARGEGGEMTELLTPCPFCGGEDISAPAVHWGGGGRIPKCNACGAEAPSVDRWNRRTPPPATAEVIRSWRDEMARRPPDDYVPQQIRDILDEWPDAETQTPRRDGRGG